MSEGWTFRGTWGEFVGDDDLFADHYRERSAKPAKPSGPKLEDRIEEAAERAKVTVDPAQHAEAIAEVLDYLKFPNGTEPPSVPEDFLEMAGVTSLNQLGARPEAHTAIVLWNANGTQKDSGGKVVRALSLVKLTPKDAETVPVEDHSLGRVESETNKLDLSLARPVPPRQSLRRGTPGIIIATFQPARPR